jgi:Protein tyrosine and serine/threonine kinase
MSGTGQRSRKIFASALEADDAGRRAVIEEPCGTRADLREDVEALLAAHAQPDELVAPLTVQALLPNRNLTAFASKGEAEPETGSGLAGTRVGPFRLIERIAQGGMGDVYRAERVDGEFTQQVAIKLLGTRLPGTAAIERFRQERQILASLEHPNIVRFLDGGVTSDGQPYIAMCLCRRRGDHEVLRFARADARGAATPVSAGDRRSALGTPAPGSAPRSEAGERAGVERRHGERRRFRPRQAARARPAIADVLAHGADDAQLRQSGTDQGPAGDNGV